MDLNERALKFATVAHAGQLRKYTNEPYIGHPIAVAEIVRSVPHTEAMVIAALLHDVAEDCDVSLDEIAREFGDEVAELVGWVTNQSKPEDGDRATRKAIDRAHIAAAPPAAKTIKLADVIDNTATAAERDPEFWKVYRLEKLALLEVLKDGSKELWMTAERQCSASMSDGMGKL